MGLDTAERRNPIAWKKAGEGRGEAGCLKLYPTCKRKEIIEDLGREAQRPIETECVATECLGLEPSLRRVDIGCTPQSSATLSPRLFGVWELRTDSSGVRVCRPA
jgi:hypothetical protein